MTGLDLARDGPHYYQHCSSGWKGSLGSGLRVQTASRSFNTYSVIPLHVCNVNGRLAEYRHVVRFTIHTDELQQPSTDFKATLERNWPRVAARSSSFLIPSDHSYPCRR